MLKSFLQSKPAFDFHFLTAIIISLFLCTITPLSASDFTIQHKDGESHHPKQYHENHQVHSHHLVVFTGATSNLEAKHTDFSLGIDYEYRLPVWHNKLGIGLLGELVFAEHKETIIGVPIFFHPVGSLKFLFAPGMAFTEDEHGHSHNHFVSRVGLGYDFHIKTISITPGFSADFIEGHISLIYGISLGIGF